MKLTQETLLRFIREEMEKTNEPKTARTNEDIISEIDSLYEEVVEELDSIDGEVFEASDDPSKIMQWMWWGPKAKKSQAKVNKVKLNIVAMEFARDNEDHPKAQKKLGEKVKSAKEQKKSLQSMVDDKFKDKGSITTRYLAAEKIKGQLEAIKATTGMSNDPNRNKDLKSKMKELNKKYTEEEEAIKATEPSTEEKKDAQKKIDTAAAKAAGKEAGKEVVDPKKAKIAAAETKLEPLEAAAKTALTAWTTHKAIAKPEDEAGLATWNKKEETLRKSKHTAQIAKLNGELALANVKEDKTKITSVQGLITKEKEALNNPDNFPASKAGVSKVETDDEVESGEDDAIASAEVEDEIEANKAADMAKGKEEQGEDPNAEPESGEDDATAKAEKLGAAKAALVKAEASGDEEAIKNAKKAITDIEAKENWQLDGTRLGGMLDARISKINSDAVLTESKYQSQSIAERFSRLL